MEKNALVKRVTGVYSVIAVLVLSFALAFALTGNYIGVEIYVGSAGSVDALQVYRKISSDGWEPLWDIPASDFNADNNYGWYERYDKELPKSGEYRYKYRFRRGSEYSPFSDPADAVTFLTQPVITSISSIGMKTTFKWKGDSYADSYQLNILAKDGGNWYDIATQSTTNTSITVKLDESYAGERLQYQLFPICDNPRGSPATGTIINLKNPALRSGTGTTQSRIQLCWNKVKGAQKYRIFRYDDASGKFVSIGEAGKDALSYIDKGRKPGTMYKYRIEAICTISGYTFVSGSSDTLDVYALTGNISKNAKLLKKKIRVKKAGYLYSVNSFIDHKGYYNFAYEKGKYVYIQKLNRKTLKPVKKIRIAKKYPIFGGITCDKSGNYYIFWGKTNPTEKKSVTTFAVSKYNYKGKHKGTCKGTSSYNVKSPSYSGYAMTQDDYGQIDKHMVVLSAMGGAGKSEMARAYAYEHMGEYLEIFWLTCTDGEEPVLQTLLDEAYRGVDTNVLRSLGYESLSGYLRSLGDDSLIIIDNLNTEDWSFINEIENSTGKADIIITSRLPQIGEIEMVAVESDDPALFALEVFRKNYEKVPRRGRAKVLQEDEIDSAKSICRSVSNNTMLSAMIGIRLREYPDLTVSACADKLRVGITSLTSGKVDFMKDNDRHKSDLAGILRFLYQDILSHKFEREEAELIALLSLYPATWFDQDYILRLLGGNDTLDYEYSANELLDLGWLQGDGIQITIHPLIAEVIQTEAAEDSEIVKSTDASFCGKLIEYYLEIPVDDQTRNRALIYRIYQNAGLSDENQKLVICAILNIPDYRTMIRNLYPEINAAYLAVVEKSGRRKYVLVPLDGTSDARALPGDVSGENNKVLFECAGNNEDRITLIRLYDQGKPYVLDLSGTIDGISLTAIPDLFCYDNNNVTDVIFSAELKSIGNRSFFCCRELKGELNLPDGVITIGDDAFLGCSRLSGELHLPDSVTTIGNSAFYHCRGLSGELHLPDHVTTIGNRAFSGCTGLSGELHLPDSVTTIGNSAFSGCSGLSGELHLPDSVTTIGDSAFSCCSGLSGELHIPDSVTTIGNSAFYLCDGLSGELHIPGRVSIIGDSVFSSCSGLSGELHLPDNVTAIGDWAFSGCTGLGGELHLPDSLTMIGDSAFSSCSGLSGELHLPDHVTTIGNRAFSGCTGLSGELHLPDSLTTIGDSAFSDCRGLSGELHLPDGVTTIGNSAFRKCSGLSGELHLPDSLTTIGDSAFSGCSGLSGELHIPDSVTTIGNSAFARCNVKIIASERLTKTVKRETEKKSLTPSEKSAYEGMIDKYGELHIPEGLTLIGDRAFFGHYKINGELHMPDSVTMIGDSAFSGCKGLSER